MRQRALTFALGLSIAAIARIALAQATQPSPDTSSAPPRIERLLIISLDGCRPDLLLRGNAPRIHQFYESGSYTFWARTTPSSITLPSHVSMLTGVVPEVHGITWNDDLPFAHPVYPAAATLFEVAKKRGYTTALVSGKSKFTVFARPGALDWSWISRSPTCDDPEVAMYAARILREHRPQVMFVHFAGIDNIGHAKGWGSPEQLDAVEQADQCVGVLLDALDDLNLRRSTAIILTADHGGAGRTHGPEDARSRTIPWVVAGPGIRQNFDLTRVQDLEIETYDTFATACALMDIRVDRRISGKFVTQIIQKRDLLRSTTQPATSASGE